jgi:hypothetical protein
MIRVHAPAWRVGRVAGAFVLGGALAFAACGACGKKQTGGEAAVPGTSSAPVVSRTVIAPEAGPAAIRDVAMWTNAREGSVEDLATLAIHEGGTGLVEAAADPELRPTALRAMAYARGWTQLPLLATTAAGKSDDDAKIALDSVLELAARPRTAEDVEDVDELREGCEGLGGLARDTGRDKDRRIPAIRALRMLPCPKSEIPTDLDAR